MKLIIRNSFTLILLFFISHLYSQKIIFGSVKTTDTDEPVPFPIIKVLGLNKLVPGNESGIFKFSVDSIPVSIQVSSIGYSVSTVGITNADSQITILLQPSLLSLNEVNVYASKGGMQASSLQSLKNIESYKLAGTTKDIFRSIQMLPGVSSNNAASANYNVRGGTYDENLMLINGIEVAEPYHVKIFPMASIGIFNIDFVQKIDFSAGGFSAEYGDALSSVLNVDYKKANKDSITGRVNLGLINLGALMEVPLNKKITLLFGARRSYLDPVIKMIEIEDKISISYYDIQTKIDYQVSPRNSISLFGIYSSDKDVVGPQTNINTFDTKWYFKNNPTRVPMTQKDYFSLDSKYDDILLALRTQHSIKNWIQLKTEFSFYSENENNPQISQDSNYYTFPIPGIFNRSEFSRYDVRKYKIQVLEGRLSSKILLNPYNTLKVGGYVKKSSFNYDRNLTTIWHFYNNTQNYPDTVDNTVIPSDPERNSIQSFNATAIKFGSFITHSLQLNNKLVFNFGLRYDYFQINKTSDFSPRISMLYSLTGSLKLNAAWGVYYKTPLMKQVKYNYSSKENTKNQKATHFLLGIEKKNEVYTFKTEMYYKKYDNLIPVRRTPNGELVYDTKDNTNEGFARGIDFEFIVSKKRYDIWFNYSLSESKERAKGTNNYYSRYTDQTHTLSSLIGYKFVKNSEFDIKITYGSGYAYIVKVLNAERNNWIVANNITSASLPYYLSFDLRYKKDISLRYGLLQVYADVMNVFNRKNILGHEYFFNSMGEPQESDFEFLGILPTIGVMYDF